jgi:apolipoprotein N-acyltransferase
MAERNSSLPATLGLAATSGALLFLADYPVHLWPLQWVALLPLLLAIERASGFRAAALAGAATGLAYAVPLRIALALPFPFGDGLALYLTAMWVVMALGFQWARGWPGAMGPVGMGAVAVVVEWVNVTVVPIWGTAQSFSRVCSASPALMQVAALTGFTGVVFLLVAPQALASRVVIRPDERRRPLFALVALIAVVALWTSATWTQSPRGYVRVAAIGWTRNDALGRERSPLALLRSRYEPLLARAAMKAPALVVTPEAGLMLAPHEREEIFVRLSDLAIRHRLTLAVGYFDIGRDTNLVRVIAPDGSLAGEYAKTNLIAFHENYKPGDGTPLVVRLPSGSTVGAMICHDDNFTGLGRAYGRARVDLVAVPTNDWLEAKDYHFESGIFRAVENRFAVVRAASNGISAIISARGEVVARMDHFAEGPGVVTAELPLHAGGTPYSVGGNWLPVATAGLLLTAGMRDLVRRRRNRNT